MGLPQEELLILQRDGAVLCLTPGLAAAEGREADDFRFLYNFSSRLRLLCSRHLAIVRLFRRTHTPKSKPLPKHNTSSL